MSVKRKRTINIALGEYEDEVRRGLEDVAQAEATAIAKATDGHDPYVSVSAVARRALIDFVRSRTIRCIC